MVSPDVGGVARARAFAKKLSDAPLAIVDKRRHGHNVAEVFWLLVFYLRFLLVLFFYPFFFFLEGACGVGLS